jgi:hypothetical protein
MTPPEYQVMAAADQLVATVARATERTDETDLIIAAMRLQGWFARRLLSVPASKGWRRNRSLIALARAARRRTARVERLLAEASQERALPGDCQRPKGGSL